MKNLILFTAIITISSCLQINAQIKKKNSTTEVQLIRNATLKINYAGKTILVDPMLATKGSMDPFAGIARNPTVNLKSSVSEIKKGVDFILVTHTHPDHFDKMAIDSLNKNFTIINQPFDKAFFEKELFINAKTIEDSLKLDDITIFRTRGTHGSGEILQYMGTVSGFVLKSKKQPTIYIVGDCIWDNEIKENIKKFNPDIIIVNSGGAIMPGFGKTPIVGYEKHPILMVEKQVIQLIKFATRSKIIAVHMESLDHCKVTRASLREAANNVGIKENKLYIPKDNEVITIK